MSEVKNQSFLKIILIFATISLVGVGYLLLPDSKDLKNLTDERVEFNFTHKFVKADRVDLSMMDARLISSEGRETSLRDLTRGKIAILNFWASWCAPCLEELPSLAKFQKENTDIFVVPISMDMQKSLPELSSIINKSGAGDLQWFYDQSGDLRRKLALSGYPVTYVLDKDGKVRYILQGPADWSTDTASAFAQLLLNKL